MSGHSKWATTKHRKGAVDAKRSKLFSKLTRIITVAAKTGGDPNPENNASLAAAVAKAKSYSLPKDKIDNAIKKAFAAGADAATYDEVIYEGYGPAGVAVYVEALTATAIAPQLTFAQRSLERVATSGQRAPSHSSSSARARSRREDRLKRRGRTDAARGRRWRRRPRGQRRGLGRVHGA